jgi:hypothetical protein
MASPKGGSAVEPGLISRASPRASATRSPAIADFFGPGTADRAGRAGAGARPRSSITRRVQHHDAAARRRADRLPDAARARRQLRPGAPRDRDAEGSDGEAPLADPAPDDGKQDATAKEIEEFLQEPDGEHDFLDWFRMLLEDLLVIDAPTVYIRPTRGGECSRSSRSTARRSSACSTPRPHAGAAGEGERSIRSHGAYQQIIKGLPATTTTR